VLTRVHIDNYRTLQGFEQDFRREHILIGRNGSGKTNLFDAVDAAVRFARGEVEIDSLFPARSVTRWDSRPTQTFELTFLAEASEIGSEAPVTFQYRLVIEQDAASDRRRVLEEKVLQGTQPLFECRSGEAQLFRDDGSRGPTVLADWSRSSLPIIHERNENRRLTWLKSRLSRVTVASPSPRNMMSVSEREEASLARDLTNLASWYRHITAEDSERADAIRKRLREVLDGFRTIDLKTDAGTAKRFWTKWDGVGSEPLSFRLDELSDGQRVLMGLAMLASGPLRDHSTLLLDEPDNYVALPEIQPLLMSLRGRPELQMIVVSHHPEVINLQAKDHGLVFWRDNNGPTRVRPFSSDSTLSPAEVVARGEE